MWKVLLVLLAIHLHNCTIKPDIIQAYAAICILLQINFWSLFYKVLNRIYLWFARVKHFDASWRGLHLLLRCIAINHFYKDQSQWQKLNSNQYPFKRDNNHKYCRFQGIDLFYFYHIGNESAQYIDEVLQYFDCVVELAEGNNAFFVDAVEQHRGVNYVDVDEDDVAAEPLGERIWFLV